MMIADFVFRSKIGKVSSEDCNDIAVMHNALERLSKAAWEGNSQEHVRIDVEDCGAAYRFVMALAAALPCRTLLTGTRRLLERPIMPLVDTLNSAGASVKRTHNGWIIDGKTLNVNEMTIDATMSSQLASALVLAAPLLGLRKLHLKTTDIPSLPYLQMSVSVMHDYNVDVEGVEEYSGNIGAIGDWSAAAFWFAHACIHPKNRYTLKPLSMDSIQGDSVIIQWFRELGMSIDFKGDEVDIQYRPVNAIPEKTFDMSGNLDLVPVLAALACRLPADFTFLNINNLQYKESNRLAEISRQMASFAEVEIGNGSLRLVGRPDNDFSGAFFDSKHDHRLAMAFLLLTDSAHISDTVCLRKSYPGLPDLLACCQ